MLDVSSPFSLASFYRQSEDLRRLIGVLVKLGEGSDDGLTVRASYSEIARSAGSDFVSLSSTLRMAQAGGLVSLVKEGNEDMSVALNVTAIPEPEPLEGSAEAGIHGGLTDKGSGTMKRATDGGVVARSNNDVIRVTPGAAKSLSAPLGRASSGAEPILESPRTLKHATLKEASVLSPLRSSLASDAHSGKGKSLVERIEDAA